MPPRPVVDQKSVAGTRLEVAESVEVLVIGAGPAGLAAAMAVVVEGLSVVLVDENPVSFATMGEEVPLHFGRGMSGAARNRNATMQAFVVSEPMIEAAFEAGVDMRLGTACWGLYANGPGVSWLPGTVAGLVDEERSWLIGAEHVVVAAGRRDMGIAFTGWDKPGVSGATAAVALATRYGAYVPRRIVLLGSSAEALFAALALRDTGVEIAAIIEQAAAPVGPSDLVETLRAGGTDFRLSHVVREATGRDGVDGVRISAIAEGRPIGGEREVACDGVVLGVGATPVIELLDALGCKVVFDAARGGYAPVVDAHQRTSVGNIYAAGDCAGLWPAKTRDRAVAINEGGRAAAAIRADCGQPADRAAAPPVAAPVAADHDISAYRLGWVRASVVEGRGEVFVCQCEEVTAREILDVRPPRYLEWTGDKRNDRSLSSLLGEGPPNPDQIKRLTRAGMGSCQGRRCREQVAALLALGGAVPLSAIPLAGYRAPVRPLPLNLAGQLPETPEQAEHWDTWFGMRAQWRPFWEVPELYTVAANDVSGPVASE